MSKHRDAILNVLSVSEIKSTNQILGEVRQKTGKAMNWYVLYHVLKDLESEGRVERYKAKAGLFWKKRGD